MDSVDTNFEELTESIEKYCDTLVKLAKTAKARKMAHDCAHNLVEVFKRVLPETSLLFAYNTPARIYARNIIRYGVDGLKESIFVSIWEDYFLDNLPVKDIAQKCNYEARTIYRHINKLPEKIAACLWEKEVEIRLKKHPQSVQPEQVRASLSLTGQKQTESISKELSFTERINFIQTKFLLTNREMEIIAAYHRIGASTQRRKIADMLIISLNTLKTHEQSIRQKTQTRTTREAVAKIMQFLRGNLERKISTEERCVKLKGVAFQTPIWKAC